MIHDLLVRGVTVFPGSEHFEFVPGINVVVGGNDSGKSHLLKLCYTVARWSADGGKKSLPEKWAEEQRLRKDLMRVFAARGLAGLTAQNRGNAHAHVEAGMEGEGVPEGMGNLVFDFRAGQEEEGLHIQEMPKRFLNVPVVFLAAREVLTIYPSFVQVGSRFPEFLDGGSWDLCRYLDVDAGSVPISTDAGRVVARLEKIIGGEVVKRDGRFFLQRPGLHPIEMSLVAFGSFRTTRPALYWASKDSRLSFLGPRPKDSGVKKPKASTPTIRRTITHTPQLGDSGFPEPGNLGGRGGLGGIRSDMRRSTHRS